VNTQTNDPASKTASKTVGKPASMETELKMPAEAAKNSVKMPEVQANQAPLVNQEVLEEPEQLVALQEISGQQHLKQFGQNLDGKEILQSEVLSTDSFQVRVVDPTQEEVQELQETNPLMPSQSSENFQGLKSKTVAISQDTSEQNIAGTEKYQVTQAVDSKAGDSKSGLDYEKQVEVEIPFSENEPSNQEIRPFTEYLAKDLVRVSDSKIPIAEFKVPSQELAGELPRIIESQVFNSEGKETSRDFIIHLEPKDLGKLTVKLTAEQGIITVKILTEHAETRQLIETGLSNLRQSFSEQGIKYGRMEVELGGQYLNQQHQQQQQQHPGFQMRWKQQGDFPGEKRLDSTYYPEDNSAVFTGRRLNSSGVVDYMA